MAKMIQHVRTKLQFFVAMRLAGIGPVHKRSDDEKGLTLLELMIVLAVVGILSAIAVPTFLSYRSKAQIALAVSELKMLEKKIHLYEIENSELPDDLSEIDPQSITDPWGNPYQYAKIAADDDEETVNGKSNEKGKGKGIGKGKKGEARNAPSLGPINTDFDLYSLGRDGKSEPSVDADASRDDIVRGNDGQYIGLVSDNY